MTVGLLSFGKPVSPSGLQIVLTFDSTTVGAPGGWTTAIQNAASLVMAAAPNTPITANISVGYGFVNGISILTNQSEAQVNGSTQITTSYATILAALNANNKSTSMAAMIAALPTGTTGPSGNPFNPNYFICSATAKALGLIGASAAIDGFIGFGTGFTGTELSAAALHEITHAIGRTQQYSPFIFSRFTSAGVWDYGASTLNAYFSLDGGTTSLAPYPTTTGGTPDYADFDNVWTNDSFDNNTTGSTLTTLTTTDIKLLNSMGYQ